MVTRKPDPLATLALTDKVAIAGSSVTIVRHAARMMVPRVPSWAPEHVRDGIMSRATPGILCDRRSGGVGPASRYLSISLEDGTQADVTCKKCRKILGLD
jgi:hypothetical protein